MHSRVKHSFNIVHHTSELNHKKKH